MEAARLLCIFTKLKMWAIFNHGAKVQTETQNPLGDLDLGAKTHLKNTDFVSRCQAQRNNSYQYN